jgi:Uncharacterized protein conserved in bacteria
MLIYDLICENEHTFEGWFSDIDDYQNQQATGLLTCPICESLQVERKLSMPNLPRKSNQLKQAPASVNNADELNSKQNLVATNTSPEAYGKLQEMLKQVHNYIDENYKDVGHNFTEEALSMHNGEKEQEPIHGIANAEQVKELADHGVEAMPIPGRPVDKDKLN